jgi:Bacterial PH domain
MSLSKIETIEIHQSIMGRMFGYGTLRFRGTRVSNDFPPYIKEPNGFKNMVVARAEQIGAAA